MDAKARRGTSVGSAGSGRATTVERIKTYILEQRLHPGDLLPTEPELCATLGVSRSSIREAIRTLSALDIVEVRHGYGTYVGRLSLSALVEGLAFRGLLSPSDDFAVLRELVEVREALETAMAERVLAAVAAGSADLDGLADLVETMEAAHDAGEAYPDQDRAFHALLIEPLGNQLMHQLLTAFWDVYVVVAPYLGMPSNEEGVETVKTHRQMLEAARTSDVGAFQAAVTRHYAPVRRRIAEHNPAD